MIPFLLFAFAGVLAAADKEVGEKDIAATADGAAAKAYLYHYRIQLAQNELLGGRVTGAESILDECPPELRHWEWRHLKRLCNAELFGVTSDEHSFGGVAYSPDGKSIAVSSLAGIKIWQADGGKETSTIGEGKSFGTVVFSPDGNLLASVGSGAIAVYNAKTGELLRSIPAHQFAIRCVVFSPDSTRLASCSGTPSGGGRKEGGEIKVWNAETGKQELHIEQRLWVNSVAFTADGKRIVSGSGPIFVVAPQEPGELKVWDAQTGEPLGDFKGHTFWITSVAISRDGKVLASASADRTVRLWNLETRDVLWSLKGHTEMVTRVAFSPDGKRLASGGRDGALRVWDVATGKELRAIHGHKGDVDSFAFSPDGDRLVATDRRTVRPPNDVRMRNVGAVKVWDLRHDAGCRVYADHAAEVIGLAASPDGRFIVSVSQKEMSREPGELIARETASGRVVRKERRFYGAPSFSADSQFLRVLDGSRWEVQFWKGLSPEGAAALPMQVYGSQKVAITGDGSRIAVGAIIHDAKTGEKLATIAGHRLQGHLTALAFSRDGATLASSNWGGWFQAGSGQPSQLAPCEVKLWNAKTGELLHTLDGAGLNVQFSPAGDRVVSGGADGLVRVWNVATGKEIHVLRGHTDMVISVAFSADGKRIASASRDHTVRVWDAELGLPVITLRGPAGFAAHVLFTGSDQFIVTGGQDGSVRVWEGMHPAGNERKKPE